MNPSTKRCLVASAGAHSLLVLTLVVGSAFRPKTPPAPTPTYNLKMIPSLIVEGALAGGGGNPKIPASEDKQKGDTLEPVPPPPAPKVVKDEPKKEVVEKPPVKPPVKEPAQEPVPVPKKAEMKQVEVKPKAKISLDDLKLAKPTTPKPPSDAEARKEKARNEFAKQIAAAANNLSSRTSGFQQGTAIEISGTGGAAYADYASIVKAIYDDAWIVTGDVADDNATATVRVKIARDGDVIEARMIKPSGSAALDRTVEQTLRKVKTVRPFPPKTTDQQRSFIINFNLKGKFSTG